MTDREMIVAAAEKVMGWKMQPRRSIGPGTYDMIEFSRPDACNVFWYPGCGTNERNWNPLESIADAWMLVEVLAKRRTLIVLRNMFDQDVPGWWVCSATGYTGGYITDQWQADAGTAPRAITIAALSAVGVEV